ncbi:hypothetical protein COO60DRAFT_5702 [Scenedesmus sp. NREL 46B-D3]|nr:hypothetical protein COO60DRAFT_5702 [Scenedesmus sp. NREL 46B-D3]
MAAALDSTPAAWQAAQQQLHELREELAAVSNDAQQVMLFAAEQQAALEQVQQQLAEVAPGGLLALREQAETARQEQQDALIQLQHASSQLAVLQPQVMRLQQDKQDLQQQLAAADADRCGGQQQLAAQAQQHAAAQEELLGKLQDQQQLLTDAVGKEQTAAAQIVAAEAQAAAAKQEQQETQQQQADQQLTQVALSHQHDLEQVLQRLQWLCSTYLSIASETDHQQPAAAPTAGSRQAAQDASSGNNSRAAALAMLRRVCCLAAGGADQLLSARYEAYQQHKLGLTHNHHNATPGGNSGTGAADVGTQMQSVSCSAGMGCLQQQMLQLEAGLLQHMLILQEALQLLQQQQQQEQQQQLQQQQRTLQSQRPGTASSRCTQDCSLAASCSNGSGSESCNLTGQLLQAMVKDRKQLAQEVKRLQAQQHQQHPGQLRYLRSSSSSGSSSSSSYTWNLHATPATLNVTRRGDSTSSREASDREVDEVLQMLQGYEVQTCQLQRRTSAIVDAAGGPSRELQRHGIGSIRLHMLA